MAREGGVRAPSTRLQNLADGVILLEEKRRVIPQVSLAKGEGNGRGLPDSWYTSDITLRSQKETVFLEISFLVCPEVRNNRSHLRRCWEVRFR